ncbi:alpha/beta fold hydrolase [Ekhidna sp.]
MQAGKSNTLTRDGFNITLKTLHYQIHRTSKSEKWIVFLHGAGGSIATWKQQLPAFKAQFNLLAIDLRDHGKSKNIDPSYASYHFNIVSNDILEVLEKENIKKAHFVTLSFGSVLIQALYNRRSDLVDKMVIIGGIFNANWMIKGFVHLARLFNLFLSYPAMYRIFSFLLMPKRRNQVARRVYQMQAKKLTQQEYLKWIGLYSEFFILLKKFSNQQIDQEMLIIMGGDDYIFLPSARQFANNRQNASFSIVPKAGHICNIEKPSAVNKEILNFLDAHKDLPERRLTTVPFDTN